MNWSVSTLILIHVIILGIFLSIIAFILSKRNLFSWTRAGFWVWASFLLYYFLNPLLSYLNNDLSLFAINLAIAGGTKRGLWILFNTLMGIVSFFIVYLRTKQKSLNWNISLDRLSVPMVFVCLLFAGFGAYSLLSYRALLFKTGNVIVEEGRFIGEVTGYEYLGYMFLFIPIIITTLSKSRYWRLFGLFSTIVFVILALPNGWSRFVLVSISLALTISDTLIRRKKWPFWGWILIILIFTVSLQQRGHTQWSLSTVGNEIINIASDSVSKISYSIGSKDASMLASWYLESFVKDTIVGYDYGLRILNYVISGWIPNRLFPDKYFIVDWLEKSQPYTSTTIEGILYGAKSTLFGSFYCEGGLLAVILLSGLAGYFCRRLDGMLCENSPILLKATGVAWMCTLWMMIGSSDTWVLRNVGIIGIPSLFLWLVSPKKNKRDIKISSCSSNLLVQTNKHNY